MFSEITTTHDIATAVWNMGVLNEVIISARGTDEECAALVAEDGRVIEVALEDDLILWTTYLDNEDRNHGDYDDQGAIELANAAKFFTSWAK